MKLPVALARHALAAKRQSPNLLFGAGVVGMVGSTVLACRSTLKLETVLETAKSDLETARTLEHRDYSEDDRKKDVAIIYVRSAVAVGKLYAPSVLLGVASIAALTKSHAILNDRVAAVSAAYAALDKGFREYRSRVVEKYGEDADRQLRFPREKVKETNAETGRDRTVEVVSDGSPSIYARFFDEYSPSWSKEPEYNLVFLKCQQNYANDLLRARGHVFLNEVYDMLGIERSQAGQVVGWVIGPEGDNFIDFGIFNGENEAIRAFVNGREGAILLDFNVDGIVYDKLNDVPKEALSWQKGE